LYINVYTLGNCYAPDKTNPTPPPHKAQNKNKNKKQIIVGCIEAFVSI
jgi:hypothetical protein